MRNFDLNVVWDPETKDSLPETLLALQNAGYQSAALNHVVHGKLPKVKCPFAPIDFPGKSSLHQYTRLTLVMDNPQHNLGINASNEIIRSYDLIAIQPENEKMFQVACTSLDCDIISLDMTGRLPFPIRPGFVTVALQRGVVFELAYGPMITDPNARRHTIGNALTLVRATKGKHIILSSAARLPWQIRAPVDVINLAGLLGIPSHLRQQCVAGTPGFAFEHAATRKHTYRGAAMIVPDADRLAAQSTDMLEDFISF